MKQNVKRVTLTGTAQEIKFENAVSNQYLVKNFSQSDIYVSFDPAFTHNDSIKIEADYWQVCQINDVLETDTIYVEGTGEVEVQQLCFRQFTVL